MHATQLQHAAVPLVSYAATNTACIERADFIHNGCVWLGQACYSGVLHCILREGAKTSAHTHARTRAHAHPHTAAQAQACAHVRNILASSMQWLCDSVAWCRLHIVQKLSQTSEVYLVDIDGILAVAKLALRYGWAAHLAWAAAGIAPALHLQHCR